MPAFIDTNIWVYALTTADPQRQRQAEALLHILETPRINGQVLREFGRVMLQKHGTDEATYQQLVPAILNACHLVQDSGETLLLASDLRGRYSLMTTPS